MIKSATLDSAKERISVYVGRKRHDTCTLKVSYWVFQERGSLSTSEVQIIVLRRHVADMLPVVCNWRIK